ncbi:MAG: ribosome maturation factor RimM [Bacillota bacterium]|nr:ribosome maturation factor RimM [Bacillota bacterium]
MQKAYLESGKIVNTHGIRGEVRIEPWCDTPEFLLKFKTLYLKDGVPLGVMYSKVHKNFVNVKFEGIESIDDALHLINKIIYINREEVVLPKGVYYVKDLVGLSVIDAGTEREYGKITEVQSTGSNDVYTVTDNKGTDTLIPGIKEVVKEVDIEGGVMKITPLAGLFEL